MRVLFLGGLGRSGTTLTERLLGELPGVCPLGEVVHLWQRGLLDGERCGCGVPFGECPFWRKVGEQAFGGWDALDVERVLALKAKVDRTRFIPALAAPRLRSSLADRVTEYVGIYRRLYEAARAVTGSSTVVDSSKHASLAYCLRWCEGLDLRVLHVVRDSRGVAHSWQKQVSRPEGRDEQAYMSRLSPSGAAVQWDAQNAAFGLLGACGVAVRRVRYEDVVAAPRVLLREMADFAGLASGEFDFLGTDGAELSAQHTVSGNPMRFRTGRIDLRHDEAWRSALPAGARRTVTAVTWPLLARYGYDVARTR